MTTLNNALTALGVHDYRGQVVLITGGTRGIGLATGLAYGRLGAEVVLTHKWGSADENALFAEFAAAGAQKPLIVEADVSVNEDTQSLLQAIHSRYGRLDVFISNVAFAQVIKSLGDYQQRALQRSIDYSAWPLVAYSKAIKMIFGAYPKYILGLSSIGSDKYTANYDFIAASKAVLETLCRYLAFRLAPEGARVNIVRAGLVDTDSLNATMGKDCIPFIKQIDPSSLVAVDEVANAILALTSGLMDAMTGQVLMVNHGSTFYDNGMYFYSEREHFSHSIKQYNKQEQQL